MGIATSYVRASWSHTGTTETYKRVPVALLLKVDHDSWSYEHHHNAIAARIVRRVPELGDKERREDLRGIAGIMASMSRDQPDYIANRAAKRAHDAKHGKAPNLRDRKASITMFGSGDRRSWGGVAHNWGPEHGEHGPKWPGEPGFHDSYHWWQRRTVSQ